MSAPTSPIETRFRATFFEEDDFTPIWGTASAYGSTGEISVACFGTPGPWGHPRPYLELPTNFLQTEVNFLDGSASLGGVTIRVLDKRQEADDQATGIVTENLRQTIGARVDLERWYDSLQEWRLVFSGRVESYSVDPDDLVVYVFDLVDPRSWEVDSTLFEVNETYSFGPQEPGPVEGYGLLPDGSDFLLRPARVLVTRHDEGAGQIPNPYNGTYWGSFDIQGDQVNRIADAAVVNQATGIIEGITVRWAPIADFPASKGGRPTGEETWTYLRQMPMIFALDTAVVERGDGAFVKGAAPLGGYTFQGPATHRLYIASTDPNELPADNEQVAYQVLARRTDRDTPYFWDRGTLGDLLEEISLGLLGSDDVPREEYDEAALAIFKEGSAPARFIQREPAPRREWVEENIYQPARFAPALTRDMKIRPVQWGELWRVLSSGLEVPKLDRRSMIPVGEWRNEGPELINKIDGSYIVESVKDQETTIETKIKTFLGVPYGTEEIEVTSNLSRWERFFETAVPFEVKDAGSIARLGPKPVGYKPNTLRVLGSIAGLPVTGDTTDPRAIQEAERFIEEAKVRYIPNGAERYQIAAQMWDPVVRDVEVGDVLDVDAPWMPNKVSGKRGARRYMQVYGIRDEDPSRRTLLLEDTGVAAPDDETAFDPADPTADCLDNSATDGASSFPAPDGRAFRVFKTDGDLVNDCVSAVELEMCLIGGGGGGGSGASDLDDGIASAGGGGGAGGIFGGDYRERVTLTIAPGVTIPITVGAGGAGGVAGGNAGGNGGDTVIWVDEDGQPLDPLTDTPIYRAYGGGGGGRGIESTGAATGGSGGGAGARAPNSVGGFFAGGSAESVDPAQGFGGGSGFGTQGFLDCRNATGGGGGGPTFDTSRQAQGGSNSGDANRGGDGVFLPRFGIFTGGGGGGAYARAEVTAGTSCADGAAQIPGDDYNGAGGTYGAGGPGRALDGVPGGAGSAGIALIIYKGRVGTITPPPSYESGNDADDTSACVTIFEEDWPEFPPPGYRVRVDYAYGATEPATSSGEWRLLGYITEAGGTICTPSNPTGTNVYTRKIAESDVTPPSAPDDPAETPLPCTPALVTHELEREGDVVTLEFLPVTECTGGLLVEAYRVSEGSETDDPANFAEVAELDASAAGSYVFASPYTLPEGFELRVRLTAYPGFSTFEPAEATFSDDFNRADVDPLDNGWGVYGVGTVEVSGNELHMETSQAERATREGLNLEEVLVQVRARKSGSGDATIQVSEGVDVNGQTVDGYNLELSAFGIREPGIDRVTAGIDTEIGNRAGDISGSPSVAQFYVAEGVQEGAWGLEASPGSETVSAADSTHAGPFTMVGLEFARALSVPDCWFDDFLLLPGKTVEVTGLPTGYKVEIENASGDVVASATESGGTASVDGTLFGGATEIVPLEGWAAVVVRDGSDVEMARNESGGVFPGLTTGEYSAGALGGVGGVAGRQYTTSLLRKAKTFARPGDAGSGFEVYVLDDDLDPILTGGLDVVTTDD